MDPFYDELIETIEKTQLSMSISTQTSEQYGAEVLKRPRHTDESDQQYLDVLLETLA